MPGYNQTTINPKVLSGNAVALMVGDQVIGFGQSTTPATDWGAEGLYGIGSAKVQEIQQFKISNTITLETFKLTQEGISFFGAQTPWVSILGNTQLDIAMLDATGNPILTYVACTCSSVNTSIPANQPVTEQTSFIAMDVLDSNGKSILANTSAVNFNPLSSTAGASII